MTIVQSVFSQRFLKVIKRATRFGSVRQPSPGFISEVRYTKADDVCFTLPKHVVVLNTLIKYCVWNILFILFIIYYYYYYVSVLIQRG
jgi:hypothetical protein